MEERDDRRVRRARGETDARGGANGTPGSRVHQPKGFHGRERAIHVPRAIGSGRCVPGGVAGHGRRSSGGAPTAGAPLGVAEVPIRIARRGRRAGAWRGAPGVRRAVARRRIRGGARRAERRGFRTPLARPDARERDRGGDEGGDGDSAGVPRSRVQRRRKRRTRDRREPTVPGRAVQIRAGIRPRGVCFLRATAVRAPRARSRDRGAGARHRSYDGDGASGASELRVR